MLQKFKLNPTVILRAEPQYYNTYVAFNFKNVETYYLKKNEYKALRHLYDRASGSDEISKESNMKHDDCENFLKRMMKLGYIQLNGEEIKPKPLEKGGIDSALYEKFPLPFLSAPTTVDVFITNRCNLNCIHCFSSTDEETIHDLSIDDLRSTFDQLENLGVFEVRINGGEPFLHPEIEKILTILKKKRFRKTILTNGTLLDENKINLLRASDVTPTISLDDSEAADHDLFRGAKGSFASTVEALKLLKNLGVQYGINCCLHTRNLERCSNIVNLAIRYCACRIAFLDLKTSKRLKNNQTWIPSYDEYQKTLLNLTLPKIRHKRKIDVALDVFLHCQPLEESISEAKRGHISCHAGRNILSIDSKGGVYPCNLVISDPKWIMGNIKNEELSEIWFSERWMFFRGGTKINDLQRCKDCKRLKKCKDVYCRLLPYITEGNSLGPHPRCR